MGEKCDYCDREATVKEVIIKDGVTYERKMCELHAAEFGLISKDGSITSIDTSVAVSKVAGSKMKQSKMVDKICESCGTSFSAFRKHGLLGCPDCYTTFEERLSPLLKRAHEGADRHTGKVPSSAGTSEQKRAKLLQLRKQLADLLDLEEYERAADVRDQIAMLEAHPTAKPDQSTRATLTDHPDD